MNQTLHKPTFQPKKFLHNANFFSETKNKLFKTKLNQKIQISPKNYKKNKKNQTLNVKN
jgi:hypothetical protein